MQYQVRSKVLILTALLVPLFGITALADEVAAETRQIGDFSGIEVSGGYTVHLSQDSAVSLRLEGDKADLADITTEVIKGRLVIKHKRGIRLFSFHDRPVSVYIGFKDINSIDLSGSNKLVGQNPLRFKDLNVDISGSGDVQLDLEALKVSADVSGSGEIALKGKVDVLIADVSGSGDIKCLDLKAKKIDLSISGSGDAKLDASEELSISISGSGDVTYRGNPGKVNQSVSGSGEITKVSD
jgi:hypothetical protein